MNRYRLLLACAITLTMASASQAVRHGWWLRHGFVDILQADQCLGFPDSAGMWRNLSLAFRFQINAGDSAEFMEWWPGGWDQSPAWYYRVEFLDQPGKADWFLSWGGGGPGNGPAEWEQIMHYHILQPNTIVFDWWELNLGPMDRTMYLTLPENQRLRITIFYDWAYILGRRGPDVFGEDRFEFESARGFGKDNMDQEYNKPEYLAHLNTLPRDTVTVLLSRQEPARGDLAFDGYFKRNGTTGNNWIPNPTTADSMVGLAFRYTNGQTYDRLYYLITFISTWQGTCMNYPVNALEPRSIANSDSFFDIRIAYPERYTIIPRNSEIDPWQAFELCGFPGYPEHYFKQSKKVSVRGYSVILTAPVNRDTLWIVAKDFAAHCIVSCMGGLTQPSRLMPFVTAWGDTTWSVSVPRDNDGYWIPYVNLGDFMADAWEKTQVAGGADSLTKIRNFLPFTTLFSDTVADFDSLPPGRNIKGDNLCNFEEYRSFWVTGDRSGYAAPDTFLRTSTANKDVFIHFLSNIDKEVFNDVPGYLQSLPGAFAVHLTPNIVDKITRRPIEECKKDIDGIRSRAPRLVSFNKVGATYPYYGYQYLTNHPYPSDTLAGATTFWTENIDADMDLDPRDAQMIRMALGLTFPWPLRVYPYFTPFFTSRCVVNTSNINKNKKLPFYQGDSAQVWNRDARIVRKKVIAHELGHSIGMGEMQDAAPHHIMSVMYWSNAPADSGRWKVRPQELDSSYANGSLNQITIRRN